MDVRQRTLQELEKAASQVTGKQALVGLDGFVDKIVHLVDKRTGQGQQYTSIKTIEAFGKRILGAAGMSTNIEMAPVVEKLGGNGPIMANALLALGVPTRYLGALGSPALHPVFEDFAKRSQAVSLCDPGVTHALEFSDGKVMLGTMASLDELTYDRAIEVMGEGSFTDMLSRCDLIAMVNWTMIPNMTAFLNAVVSKILPNLPPRDQRHFFFDLADPEKRSDGDVKSLFATIKRYTGFGEVTLGLNLKEAQQIERVLGHAPVAADAKGLKEMATRIRRDLELRCVVIHPKESAACATRDDAWYVEGPYCEEPKITTGAGDHFNAGFMTGQLLGLSPESCLMLAVSTSGYYVRTGESGSLSALDSFVRNGTVG